MQVEEGERGEREEKKLEKWFFTSAVFASYNEATAAFLMHHTHPNGSVAWFLKTSLTLSKTACTRFPSPRKMVGGNIERETRASGIEAKSRARALSQTKTAEMGEKAKRRRRRRTFGIDSLADALASFPLSLTHSHSLILSFSLSHSPSLFILKARFPIPCHRHSTLPSHYHCRDRPMRSFFIHNLYFIRGCAIRIGTFVLYGLKNYRPEDLGSNPTFGIYFLAKGHVHPVRWVQEIGIEHSSVAMSRCTPLKLQILIGTA